MKGKGTERMNSAFDEAHKATIEAASKAQSSSAGTKSGRPQPPLQGVAGFFSAFAKEVKKDLGLGK